jgi:molecular chaperone GrpE
MKKEEEKNIEDLEEIVEEQQEKVSDELQELQKSIEEFEGKYKRALADYQNLQKRVTEEKGEWIRSANKDLLLRLLPVLDTLMMAEKHLQDQGLQVSINQFLDILKGEGVIRVKTVGVEFDPFTMECVTTEEGEENKVLEELRAGYMLYDKVLRPAQVKVGKK